MTLARPKKINQSDIARLANVSISTVSRALGNGGGVSPEIREHVRRIAGELGYDQWPEDAAGAAATNVVVYLPMHPATGGLLQLFQEIYAGVEQEAAICGIELHPKLVPEEDVDYTLVAAAAQVAGTDAALMFSMYPVSEVAAFFEAPGRNLVLVNTIDEAMRFDSIVPDNYHGSKIATRAALAAGHRSLLYVVGDRRHSLRERVRGFSDAISEVPDASGEVLSIGHDRQETAYTFFNRYFSEHERLSFTAMLCANDLVALGVIHAARENGLSVPEDFSIAGFDNIGWSNLTTPRLSTVDVDRQAIGREAVRLLKRRIEDPAVPVLQCVQGVSFIPGGTILPKSQKK